MTEEENEVNENDTALSSTVDFLSDGAINLDEDLEVSDKDDGLSFSFGGSRGFEE